MDEQVYSVLLNGMPFKTFMGFFLIGMIGALLFYLSIIYKALNPNSPKIIFDWRKVIRGIIKLLMSFASLAICIIYFKEISPFLFNITGTEHDHVVDINGFSALILGIGIDRLWTGLLRAGTDGAKYLKKK